MCVCVFLSTKLALDLLKGLDRLKLLHDVEVVLLSEDAPNDGDIFDDNNERNGTQSAHHAAHEPEEAESRHAEGLDGSDEVEVEISGTHKAAQKVEGLPDRYGIEGREPHVRCGERQREPTVKSQRQAKARLHRQFGVVHHQEDALDPALALLQKVPERERRLLPHLSLDPVERVSFGHR